MPVYSLTSPETGRSYQVNIDGEPDSEDMDAIWPQLDAHAAQREADKPFFALGDTLSGIGTALGGIPETATASFYRLTEGMKRPDQYSPAARAAFDEEKKFTEQVQKESQDRLMRGEASSTGESFRDAASSLGFSGVTMGANILGRVVGRPLGAVAGGLVSAPTGPGAVGGAGLGATIGSTAGGMAASGYAAYRMAGNQFLDSAFNRIGEERAKRGEPWGENEKAQAYNELLPLAQDTGLWEAGPEAVGNAVGFGAGKYVLGLGKKTVTELADSIWKKTLKKGAAALGGMGTEVGTETITQVGSAPAQAQAQALAQGNPNWRQEPGPYAGPGGTLQAMADVAPATLAQSALMLGAGGAVKAGQALIPGATPQAPSLSAVQPERPEGRTTNSASSISPLPGIAQRAGTVDVPPLVPGLEVEDLGPLTAGDVADLNPAPAPTPRQPILGNVPDAVQGVGQPMSDAFSQQPQGGQSAQPGSASVTPAGSSPAAAANTGQTMPAERVVSTGKPNGAQVTAVIDFVEAEDLEPLLLREVGSDQTRDRANNRGSAEQIASIATSPDAQLLGDSPVSSMGAPVVDDVILAGNGRAEGLLQGYRGGGEGISNYRAQVVQQAAAQGRADVAGMKQPVMIRRVTGYVRGDRRSFVTESNPKYATLQETVAEAALLDAEVLGDMAGIEFTQSGQLTSSSLQQVATKLKEAQRGVNATTGGKPDVVEGTRRVQLASLAKLAKDNGVDVAELSGLLETDVGRRAVAEVSKAAPRLAALDADLGLGDVMLSALRSFSEGARAVSQGIFKNLTEWADNRGQELIRDELSPEAGQLLEIMIDTVRTPTKLRELFDTYLEAATNEQTQRNQAAGSDDIFGETRRGVQGRELIRRQMAGTTDTAPATAQSSGGQGNAAVITPTRPTATAAATPPAAAPAATPVRGEVGSGGAGGAALLDVAPSTRPRNRGETAKPQRDDVLAELGQATREGAANQAQGQFEAIEAARKAASDRIMAQLQSGGIEVSAAELTASTQRGFKTFSVDGSTAGFANFQILNEGFDLVQRGFNTFAAWSQAMLARFGQGIREFLAVIWSQVTGQERQEIIGGQTNAVRNVRMGMPQGNAPVSVGQAGFIPNPLHKQGEAFRVKAQIGRALLTGSPLPKDYAKALDATDNERRSVDQTVAMVGRDLDVAVNAHSKRTGKPLADVWAMVETVMTGQPGALTVLTMLDANLGERARRARNLLDELTVALARTLPAGQMRDTIIGNLGQWMRRGYAAFDAESGWSFDKVMAAAKAGKLIAGKDAAMILANARAYLQGQNPAATAAEIEADMRDLMDRDTWQSALLGGTVKKAVGSLMRRKDIAPEIRALMGEETNPLHRYLQSAKFQAQLIARHHGQVAMRTIGLATGLLKAARGGVYTVEIPKTGYQWSGLGGTFTTPELMTALNNSSGILQDGNSWGGWLVKTLKALGNEAKLNRVALNLDSWLVNVLGGFVSMVQSGDIYATSIVRRLREAGGTIGSTRTAATANALQDAQRALLARLTEQGVIGSSITVADIEASLPRHLLQWVAENETRDRALGAAQGALIGQSMGRGLGLPGRAVGGAIGAVGGALAGTQKLQKWRQNVAEWTMTKPDNLFRVTGWLTNYETALAAGMQPDAAAKWASERTLNTFPNYNALPAVLREFSRLGLVGSFIAFQYEVYRNTYWNIRYAVREMGSGNAALQARGLQRLAGLTSIAALTFGGGLAALLGMSGAAGADDERNKIFRKWFAAPWERDAVLAFDNFTPESVSYINTSYLLPQVTIQELAQAASEGVSEGEAVQRVMARLWEQFAASSVHLSPIINAALNVDRNGRPITNRPGVAGALERADSAVATIGEPGFADKMTRIAYALREAERRGRKFSVEQEIKRVFGLRGYERTWDTLVKGRYSRFGSEYQAIREDANRVLGENLPGAQVKAIEEANARIAELEKQRVQFEADMGRLGIEPGIIRAAKKDSAFNALNAVRVRADGKRVEAVTRR
jgi:hypothetical protein